MPERSGPVTCSFDAVGAPEKPHWHGCRRCGAPTAGTVMLALNARVKGKIERRIRSLNRAFCEPCAAEVFLQLEALLLEEARWVQ